jgi:hypothetical protein
LISASSAFSLAPSDIPMPLRLVDSLLGDLDELAAALVDRLLELGNDLFGVELAAAAAGAVTAGVAHIAAERRSFSVMRSRKAADQDGHRNDRPIRASGATA